LSVASRELPARQPSRIRNSFPWLELIWADSGLGRREKFGQLMSKLRVLAFRGENCKVD
jgi:hypothetical protein